MIQGVELKEPQLQPAPAVTVTVRLPLVADLETDTLAGVTLYAHAAAACETVIVCPATVMVPVRAAPVLAATL